jgi:TonB family protein
MIRLALALLIAPTSLFAAIPTVRVAPRISAGTLARSWTWSSRAPLAPLPTGQKPLPQLPAPHGTEAFQTLGETMVPEPRQQSALKRAVATSLALHALAVGGLSLSHDATAPQPSKTIEVELVAPKESKDKQVVWSNAGQETETPDKDAYLGEKNRRVDRETTGKIQKAGGGAQPQTARTPGKTLKLSDLGVPLFKGGADARRPQEHGPDGVPQDVIKGLKEGETTALNTRETVYFSYYNRIRERLDWAWNGFLRESLEKRARQGKALSDDMDYTTKTIVTLDKNGAVVRVQVAEDSGLVDLDDAAVKAFNKAGPFPNPPKGLFDPDGYIRIRWDFILKT